MAGIGGSDHDVGLGGGQLPGLRIGFACWLGQQFNRLALEAAGAVDFLQGKLGRGKL